ncbi:hypothetical protein ACUN0C_16315 [Faunimonas sp. B44]|uniref:hypothetical protein n=1 Tax=Faunimonas sp. B44 TaxID=3461493 RepID=UPI0040447E0A
MNPLLLLRMAYWIRRRPSRRWLIAAGTAIAAAVAIVAIEHLVGWPEALKLEPTSRRGQPLR